MNEIVRIWLFLTAATLYPVTDGLLMEQPEETNHFEQVTNNHSIYVQNLQLLPYNIENDGQFTSSLMENVIEGTRPHIMEMPAFVDNNQTQTKESSVDSLNVMKEGTDSSAGASNEFNSSIKSPTPTPSNQINFFIYNFSSTTPPPKNSLYKNNFIHRLLFRNGTKQDSLIPSPLRNNINDESEEFVGYSHEDPGDNSGWEMKNMLVDERESNGQIEETPKLTFSPMPKQDLYELDSVDFSEGIFLFSYLADFLSFIQPYDFPVELIRDLLWNRLSLVSLIFQSLRAEAGFVGLVSVGVVTAFVVPTLGLAAMCSSMCVPAKQQQISQSCLNSQRAINSTRRSFICVLLLMIIILGASVAAMLTSNEQLSSAMLRTPDVVSTALNDADTFVNNANRQITHVTLAAFDQTLAAIFSDLNNVEELLGKPVQKQVAAETGVDVALDALVEIATVSSSISQNVAELQECERQLRDLSSEARNRLVDLRAQVDGLRRACSSRDRPLCDTIDSAGLDITFRADLLKRDARLGILLGMASSNLTALAERVRGRFANLPADIAIKTEKATREMREALEQQREVLSEAMRPLQVLTRHLRAHINQARQIAALLQQNVAQIEQWRWLLLFFTGFMVLLIWLLLTTSLVYACCDKSSKAKSMLIGGLVLSSCASLVLWAVALAALLVGGHGQVFVCRPLYDQPEYKSLTRLLDDPGVLFQQGGGLFKNLLPRNQTLKVQIKTILRECEENQPVYTAFGLENILNVEAASNFKIKPNLLNQLTNLKGNFTHIKFIDIEFQDKLQSLLQATSVNMSSHRIEISRALTEKDLMSFSKQLDSVANQIKDLATASRIETLASRTRRIISTNMAPLQAKREELLYRVTALEVQIVPLQRHLNQTLSHLKTIQFYIDSQAANISQMRAVSYTRRLSGYLSVYRSSLVSGVADSVAPCLPVHRIFNSLRHHICKQIMDPLNGFWFSLVVGLLVLALATPTSLNLIYYFGLSNSLLGSRNGGSVRSMETGAEAAVWNTPGTEDSNSW